MVTITRQGRREERRQEAVKRDRQICLRYEGGEQIPQLAAAFGLTRGRIYQILWAAGFGPGRNGEAQDGKAD